MPGPRSTPDAESIAASREDLRRLFGDIDERRVLEILALRPTIAEVEQASVWASGDADVLAKTGHTLTGTTAQIVEILASDEEEEPSPTH